MRVAIGVRKCVMLAVVCNPAQRPTLHRNRSAGGGYSLHEPGCHKASMCKQSVVAHGDSKPRHRVQHEHCCDGPPVDEYECGEGPRMHRAHEHDVGE